jgi:hypothetical protein
MKDYYQTLGIYAQASHAEIKSAFRKMVVQYHPDKNPSAEASRLIVEINEAYEVLGDPAKRNLYDDLLAGRKSISEAPQAAQHRDPAYRKRPPSPNFKSKQQLTLEMMQEYLPVTLFMSRVAFALFLFITLDFLLPTVTQQETIQKITMPRTGPYQTANKKFFTNTGTGFEVSSETAKKFKLGMAVQVTYSSLVHVPTYLESSASNITIKVPTTIYGTFIFIPLLLMVTSSIGSFYRKGVEFSFNIGITNCLLTLFTFIFLFIHKML